MVRAILEVITIVVQMNALPTSAMEQSHLINKATKRGSSSKKPWGAVTALEVGEY